MAASNSWSTGKILGVMGGIFAVLIIATLITVNIIKHKRDQQSSMVAPSQPSLAPLDTPGAGQGASQSSGQAQVRTPGPRGASGDVLEGRLDETNDHLDQLSSRLDDMGKQNLANNQAITQNFNTLQAEMKTLGERINSLEHPNTGPVEIVKPVEKPRVSETARLAKKSKSIPSRSGYKTEAVVLDQAWLRVDGDEHTVHVGDPLPQASEPARIEAMSADSGIYVMPDNSRTH